MGTDILKCLPVIRCCPSLLKCLFLFFNRENALHAESFVVGKNLRKHNTATSATTVTCWNWTLIFYIIEMNAPRDANIGKVSVLTGYFHDTALEGFICLCVNQELQLKVVQIIGRYCWTNFAFYQCTILLAFSDSSKTACFAVPQALSNRNLETSSCLLFCKIKCNLFRREIATVVSAVAAIYWSSYTYLQIPAQMNFTPLLNGQKFLHDNWSTREPFAVRAI